MKRLMWLLLLVAAPVAVSAQNVAGASSSSPPGLLLEAPGWSPASPNFTGGFDLAPSLVGSPRPNTIAHANIRSTRTGNVISYSGGPVPDSRLRGYGGAIWRSVGVTATNTGIVAIKSVHLEFVFTDPATGAEVLRIRRRSKKRLNPGKSYNYEKTVKASERNRRGDGAKLSIDVREVVYADRTVWRAQ